MKRTLMLFAAGIVASALAACASQPTVQITPAQFIQAACGPVQDAMDLLPDFAGTIPPAVADKVSKAMPMVDAACAAGAAVSIATVTDFANTVLPAADAVVQSAPASLITNDQKLQIGGAILLAELAVKTVSQVVQNEATAAGAASATDTMAVAPQ